MRIKELEEIGKLDKKLDRKPQISVIIPAYNIAPYLARCLESVRQQTYKELQIIIVNDGSTDQTGKIADFFSEKDKRFHVIHKENGGVSAARKTGLEKAEGDYIGFVDGDDYIEPMMYERLIDLAIKHDADIAHCGYQMVFPKRVDLYYGTKAMKVQDTYTGVRDLLEGTLIEPGLVNKIYHHKLFKDIEYNENIVINEDLLLNYFLFHRSEKAVFIDVPYYHYMVRKNSATTSDWNEHKLLDPICVLEIMYKKENDEELKKIICNRYIYQLVKLIILRSDKQELKLPKYQKEFRKKLKKLLRQIDRKDISTKNYWMAEMALKCTWGLRYLHKLHGRIKGTNNKYNVDG